MNDDMTSSACGCKHKHKGHVFKFKKYIFNSTNSFKINVQYQFSSPTHSTSLTQHEKLHPTKYRAL